MSDQPDLAKSNTTTTLKPLPPVTQKALDRSYMAKKVLIVCDITEVVLILLGLLIFGGNTERARAIPLHEEESDKPTMGQVLLGIYSWVSIFTCILLFIIGISLFKWDYKESIEKEANETEIVGGIEEKRISDERKEEVINEIKANRNVMIILILCFVFAPFLIIGFVDSGREEEYERAKKEGYLGKIINRNIEEIKEEFEKNTPIAEAISPEEFEEIDQEIQKNTTLRQRLENSPRRSGYTKDIINIDEENKELENLKKDFTNINKGDIILQEFEKDLEALVQADKQKKSDALIQNIEVEIRKLDNLLRQMSEEEKQQEIEKINKKIEILENKRNKFNKKTELYDKLGDIEKRIESFSIDDLEKNDSSILNQLDEEKEKLIEEIKALEIETKAYNINKINNNIEHLKGKVDEIKEKQYNDEETEEDVKKLKQKNFKNIDAMLEKRVKIIEKQKNKKLKQFRKIKEKREEKRIRLYLREETSTEFEDMESLNKRLRTQLSDIRENITDTEARVQQQLKHMDEVGEHVFHLAKRGVLRYFQGLRKNEVKKNNWKEKIKQSGRNIVNSGKAKWQKRRELKMWEKRKEYYKNNNKKNYR